MTILSANDVHNSAIVHVFALNLQAAGSVHGTTHAHAGILRFPCSSTDDHMQLTPAKLKVIMRYLGFVTTHDSLVKMISLSAGTWLGIS